MARLNYTGERLSKRGRVPEGDKLICYVFNDLMKKKSKTIKTFLQHKTFYFLRGWAKEYPNTECQA